MTREDNVIAAIREACAAQLAAGHSLYGIHPEAPDLMIERTAEGR